MRQSKTKKGFTLVELLVVIAIINILAGMLLPSLTRAREEGRRVVCLSNLRNIGQVLTMYASASEGFFPPENSSPTESNDLDLLYPSYLDNPEVFWCPSDAVKPATFHRPEDDPRKDVSNCSYGYLGKVQEPGGAIRPRRDSDPSFIRIGSEVFEMPPLVGDDGCGLGTVTTERPNHTGGGNLLYPDGHVRFTPTTRWPKETVFNLH